MTRSILCGLLALVSVGAVGIVPVACQSGGVGDHCTPEDEFNPAFAGFKQNVGSIESRSFSCQTRICLVNQFQGRVSCPAGQDAPTPCTKNEDCSGGATCTVAETYAPECDPGECPTGWPLSCSKHMCVCDPSAAPPQGFSCIPDITGANVLTKKVCHVLGNCQDTSLTTAQNINKDCCIPGTDKPVTETVCGQCSGAAADNSVYCSCRCCPRCCTELSAEEQKAGVPCESDPSACGSGCDPNYNYCSCPGGFVCDHFRTNEGLGQPKLAGAYCLKAGQGYKHSSTVDCGDVNGHWVPGCFGQKTAGTSPDAGADGG